MSKWGVWGARLGRQRQRQLEEDNQGGQQRRQPNTEASRALADSSDDNAEIDWAAAARAIVDSDSEDSTEELEIDKEAMESDLRRFAERARLEDAERAKREKKLAQQEARRAEYRATAQAARDAYHEAVTSVIPVDPDIPPVWPKKVLEAHAEMNAAEKKAGWEPTPLHTTWPQKASEPERTESGRIRKPRKSGDEQTDAQKFGHQKRALRAGFEREERIEHTARLLAQYLYGEIPVRLDDILEKDQKRPWSKTIDMLPKMPRPRGVPPDKIDPLTAARIRAVTGLPVPDGIVEFGDVNQFHYQEALLPGSALPEKIGLDPLLFYYDPAKRRVIYDDIVSRLDGKSAKSELDKERLLYRISVRKWWEPQQAQNAAAAVAAAAAAQPPAQPPPPPPPQPQAQAASPGFGLTDSQVFAQVAANSGQRPVWDLMTDDDVAALMDAMPPEPQPALAAPVAAQPQLQDDDDSDNDQGSLLAPVAAASNLRYLAARRRRAANAATTAKWGITGIPRRTGISRRRFYPSEDRRQEIRQLKDKDAKMIFIGSVTRPGSSESVALQMLAQRYYNYLDPHQMDEIKDALREAGLLTNELEEKLDSEETIYPQYYYRPGELGDKIMGANVAAEMRTRLGIAVPPELVAHDFREDRNTEGQHTRSLYGARSTVTIITQDHRGDGDEPELHTPDDDTE